MSPDELGALQNFKFIFNGLDVHALDFELTINFEQLRYGNHLNNTQEAVEVMLLPRLMAMNCHHFAFDACNFSERNMYLKGKRDGLSKEGSGRVAVYKSTGLIKSYTLESNYNMAKQVNILPPKGKEVSCKVHNLIPPKFSPTIFEEVGKALGP